MPQRTFEPRIPTSGTKVPADPDWIHEIKHDGYRLIVHREGKRVRLFTRNGVASAPPRSFFHPHPRPATVLGNELDASLFEGFGYGGNRIISDLDRSASFCPLQRWNGDAGRLCDLGLRKAGQRPSSS
jgi:hypothetical protein